MLGLSIPNLDKTRSRRDYNRYEIAYSSIQQAKDFAVQPMVFLETSYTAVSFPVVELDVHNYIGDMMTEEAPDYIEQYQLSPFKMKVQSMDRTLADKVFAICDYYLQGKVNGHSRHLYDIFKLLPFVPQNEEFKNLVRDVRTVRAVSPVCPSAKEGVDVTEAIKEKAQNIRKDAMSSKENTIQMIGKNRKNLENAGLITKEYQKRGLPLKIYVNDITCLHQKSKPAQSPTPYDVSFSVEKAELRSKSNRGNFGDIKQKKSRHNKTT